MKNQAVLGLLQVVGTPIGNLGDMSERAKKAMAEADLVACEDTRRCGQLYRLLGLKAPKMVSFFKENEGFKTDGVIKALHDGLTVVLVSDAGMPGVSDPGAGLVAAARAAHVRVEVIPGPSAVVTAIAGSGFEGGFVFAGFPERKPKALKTQLEALVHERRTMVFYESPQRVTATIGIMVEVFGGTREAWVARELTKMHEEWIGPDLTSIYDSLVARDVKGECVIVVKGGDGERAAVGLEDAEILTQLKSGMSTKDVTEWAVAVGGLSKKEAYARVLGLKERF